MYLVWINNREKKGGQVKRKVGLMSGRFPAVNRCRRRHHHHRATTQGCWSRDEGGVRGWAPHILEDELTYSNQGGGGQIMPTTLGTTTPSDFRTFLCLWPLHCNALSSCLINNAKKFHSVFSGLKQSHAKWLIAMISPLCIYLLPALALAEKANRYLAYPCNAFSCNLKQYTMQSCVVCTFDTETVEPNCNENQHR